MHGALLEHRERPSKSLTRGVRASFRKQVEMKETAGRKNGLCKDRQEVHGDP